MACFTARVELHHPANYAVLHQSMKAQGFDRVITFGGVLCHLPPGEYIITAVETGLQILARAQVAAHGLSNPQASILVTGTDGWWASGLPPV